MKIIIINGPNLNLLGKREKSAVKSFVITIYFMINLFIYLLYLLFSIFQPKGNISKSELIITPIKTGWEWKT